MGNIVHAYPWDKPDKQHFVTLNPSRDEICLYESIYDKKYQTNKVSSLSNLDSIQTIGYSPCAEGVIAAGQSNGVVNLCNLYNSSLIAKLRPKQSRPCNSVSLNSQGLVAVGLDKVRNDTSLMIWQQGADMYKMPLESYLPNEVVVSVSFLKETPSNLLCGSYKFLREFDVRSPTPIFQCAAKCSHGIQINPFNDIYFTTHADDGTFAVWDRRQIKHGSEPALYMNRPFGDNTRKVLGCCRWSQSNSKEFAIINDGVLMRRWQIGVTPVDKTTGIGQKNSIDNEALFAATVLDSRTDYDKVAAFDYTSDISSPYSVNFMCIRHSGQVFRMKCVESPDAAEFDPYNNVAVVDPERITIIQSKRGPHEKIKSKSFERKEAISPTTEVDEEEDEEDEDSEDDAYFVNPTFEGMLDFKSVLEGDISCVIRKRAINGYSLDCEKNIELLHKEHGDGYLKYTWQWLLCAKRAEEKKSMISDTLDLGFEGVLGIWEGSSGLHGQTRQLTTKPISETDFEKTVTAAISKSSKNVFVSNNVMGGVKHARRKLCLRVAGWNFDLTGLDVEIDRLVENGKYEKAAGWAVFHGDVGRAVKVLATSKKERLRLMSTAVAGYLAYKDSTMNSPWRDQCRKLASELDDPYLRAIFAFISDGSWTDVLDESSLPLVESLGIALRFLSDNELTTYLNRVTARAVQKGDLEGIMLTGITPRMIPLLQSYVDKTSDVQTVSLIVSFGSPRFFDDPKVEMWISEYQRLLNSWKMFRQRAKFDVGRTRLSKNYSGEVTAKPIPKQIYLRCGHCKKTINAPQQQQQHYQQQPAKILNHITNTSKQGGGSKVKSISSSLPDITRCPSCNSPLPRCAVCLLPMGSPIPGEQTKTLEQKFDRWPTFCLSCNHGLHAGHAREWFAKHGVCPVPDCSCLCNR